MHRTTFKTPRATLGTVARLAGVSTATVSLILSEREDRVRLFNPETIRKVREAADRCGYHPNLFATGMRTAESVFFALVLKEMLDRERDTWHHWAFEGSFLAGVAERASEKNRYPVVLNTAHEDIPDDVQKVSRIIDGGVFGAIVRTPGASLEELLRSRLARGYPLVVVFPKNLTAWKTNALDVDNLAIGRTAGELLARAGRRQWVGVHYAELSNAHQQRIRGLSQAARAAGATLRRVSLSFGGDEHDMRRILADNQAFTRANGIFAVDSVSSVGSLLACMVLGKSPAVDLDLIGCDCAYWSGSSLPRITSVDISWNQVGKLALDQLIEITCSGKNRFKTFLLPPRVVQGGTSKSG